MMDARALNRLGAEILNWGTADQDGDGGLMLAKMAERWYGRGAEARIIEVGTCRCVGASILSEFGTVYTLDVLNYDGQQKVMDVLGTSDRIIRIAGPMRECREMLSGMRFDFAFLDAWHAYTPVIDDFNFLRGVTDRVIFHDYHPAHEGCKRAIDELMRSVPGEWTTEGVFAAWDGTEHGN